MHLNKKIIKIISFTLIILTIFTFTVVLATDDTVYVWSSETEPLSTQANTNEASENETTQTSAEETTTDNTNSLNLKSGGAILIEQKTGQVLYDHNMHEQLRPASVTKVMSLLLIMEALDSGQIALTDKVPCTEDAAGMGGSQIWLEVGEELTVDEMLKAICVVSANDCTVAMADYLCGSQDAFVQKMNERAKELGMNDTTFKNCHGIDEDGHVTSAYDIALMSRELLNNHPTILNYTTIWMDTLRDGESELVNTNKLIRNYKGVTSKINLSFENDVGVLLKKGEDKNIEQTVNIEENLSAPIVQGQKVGEVIYTLNGEEVGRTNVIAETGVEKKTFFSIASYVYRNWFSMLRI